MLLSSTARLQDARESKTGARRGALSGAGAQARHEQAHRRLPRRRSREPWTRASASRRAVAATDDPGVRKALAKSQRSDLDELTGTIYDLALKAQSLQASLQGSNIDIRALQRRHHAPGKHGSRIPRTTSFAASTRRPSTASASNCKTIRPTEALNRWHAQLDNALARWTPSSPGACASALPRY